MLVLRRKPDENDPDASLEMLAAELTSAAYNVVIQHGVGDKWLDVQLAL